jgi:hypothetical protein
MRKPIRVALIAAVGFTICISLASQGHAWDHQRKGFILGGGLGALGIWDPIDAEGFGWAAGDIKIGYAPSDQLMLYYTSRNLIFPALMGGLSFGANYYMKPQAPALYFTGGGGVFGGTLPWAIGWGGYSIYSGAGYEFARHWAVALELGYTFLEIASEEKYSGYNGIDLRVLINLTGY